MRRHLEEPRSSKVIRSCDRLKSPLSFSSSSVGVANGFVVFSLTLRLLRQPQPKDQLRLLWDSCDIISAKSFIREFAASQLSVYAT